MPALQCLLLAFFSVVAAFHWPLYNMALLLPAFVVGGRQSRRCLEVSFNRISDISSTTLCCTSSCVLHMDLIAFLVLLLQGCSAELCM